MPELLSDETWRQLDPSAGRLPRGAIRWHLVGAGVFVAVMVVIFTGLAVPRLGLQGSGYGYDESSWIAVQSVTLRNDGAFPVDVVGAGRDGPGLVQVDGADRFARIEPGESATVAVRFEVTDCAAVPAESWPVPVRVARPWGVHTVWLELPRQSSADFDLPPTHTQGDAAIWSDDVEWQRNLADAVCYHRDGVVPGRP